MNVLNGIIITRGTKMAKTTGLESVAQGSTKILNIDPRIIKVREGWNSRDFSDPENAEYVEGLANNIMEVGKVKEPLTVTWENGEVWLDNGECRLRGALLAISRGFELKTVPTKSEDRYLSPLERLRNQRLYNSGKSFSVFEDAKHFKRMLDCDASLTEEGIAKMCLISKAQVIRILEHNTIGKVGKDAVLNGQASASLVLEATKELGTSAEQALREGLEKAKKTGKKLKPSDVAGLNKISLKKVMVDAMEYADVNDEDPSEVVVRIPTEHWDKIKEAFKL